MTYAYSLLLLICLGGCATASTQQKPMGPRHPIVAKCTIQDANGKLLWSYPSLFCQFYPDGSFVSADDKGMDYHSPDGKILWHKDIALHHMITIAENGDLLVLASEWKTVGNQRPPFRYFIEALSPNGDVKVSTGVPKSLQREKFRVDKVIRLSRDGKLVAEKTFSGDSKFSFEILSYSWYMKKVKDEGDKAMLSPYEASHFNSVYEIPENSSPLPAFKRGNIVLNDVNNRHLTILSGDLREVLWTESYDNYSAGSTHDVQILPNGNILLFQNYVSYPNGDSSLVELNPVTHLPVWRFYEKPRGSFRAWAQGSVQSLADNRVLYHFNMGSTSQARIIDRSGKQWWSLDLTKHFDASVQGVYEMPVEEFLRNNKRP